MTRINLYLLLFLGFFGGNSLTPLYSQEQFSSHLGAVIRGDTTKKQIALVFTGHEFAEGGSDILKTLKEKDVKASFFFTGDFYRNPSFASLIKELKNNGHYLGAHSDRHLLYNDWSKRDSMLVSKEEFSKDLLDNYGEMAKFGIGKESAEFYLPPYEWYNDSISRWTREWNLQLINFSPGTLSHADYTTPKMPGYRSSRTIYNSILDFEESSATGLNGFILLVHIGAGPERDDKFYGLLDELLGELKAKDYEFLRVDALLK